MEVPAQIEILRSFNDFLKTANANLKKANVASQVQNAKKDENIREITHQNYQLARRVETLNAALALKENTLKNLRFNGGTNPNILDTPAPEDLMSHDKKQQLLKLRLANVMRQKIIDGMENRIRGKNEAIEREEQKLNNIQGIELPVKILPNEIREQYIFRTTFEGDWAKAIIIKAFAECISVRGDAYFQIRAGLR